jgi:hypothetical protein
MCNRPHLSSAAIGLFYGSPLRLRPLPTTGPPLHLLGDAIRCHCDAMRFPQPKPYLPDRDRVPMVQRSSRVSASTMHKGKSITAPYTAHRRISESTSTRISFPAPISPISVRDLRSSTPYYCTYRIFSGSRKSVLRGPRPRKQIFSSPSVGHHPHGENRRIFSFSADLCDRRPLTREEPAKVAKPSQTIQL